MKLASAARGMILPYALVLLSGSIASAEIAVSGNDAKPKLTDGAVSVDPNRGPDNIVILDMKGPMRKVIGRVGNVPTSVVGPPSSVAITPDEGLALVSRCSRTSAKRKLVKVTEAPQGGWPQGVAFSHDAKTLLAGNMIQRSGGVYSFESKTLKKRGEIPMNGGSAGLRIAGGN